MFASILKHAAALLISIAVSGYAAAQTFPAKLITIIVPFAAGSATDQFARAVAQSITEQTGQPAIVDNKGGASGIIGASAGARAAPDGYTFVITTNTTHAGNEFLFKALPYDPVKDFVPLAMLGKGQQVMVVSPSSPFNSVSDFLGAAKRSPGRMSFGAGSVSPRIAGELLQQMTGIKLLYVPYKSNPDVLNDLIGGRIDMAIVDATTVLPHVRSGKLRALGATGATRLSFAPEVPAIAETVPGYEIGYWFAGYAPAGTPPDIAKKLSELLLKATQGQATQKFYSSTGTSSEALGQSELAAFQRAESTKWGEVIRKADIPME
ncbi:tripartite tricarboxylate transporter substrate binding protein [soil metagenome]